MVALVLWNLAAWIVVAGLRFGDDVDLALFGVRAGSWPMIAGVAAGLAVLAFRREVADERRPCGNRDRLALWILLGLGPLTLWSVGDREPLRGVDTIVFGVMALVGLERVFSHRRDVFRARAWFGVGGTTGRWLALGTAVVLAGLAAVALSVDGVEASPTKWALALATYPLYALVQLAVALVLPARVWRDDGHGARAVVVAAAVLFALIHAPNPVAMVLTGVGMIGWMLASRRGVGLAWLALSMGLCGATVAQGLPFAWTENLRVNAGFVLARQTERHIRTYDARVDDLASDATFDATGGDLRGWLARLYVEAFADDDPPAWLLDDWTHRTLNANRDRIVRVFLDSAEFRRRHGVERIMEGEDRSLLFSTFEPWHPAQQVYEALRVADPAQPPAPPFEDFLRATYQATLQRVASTEEIEGWDPVPPARDRIEVVRVVLAQAGIEDPAVWRRPPQWPVWARP